MNIGKVRGRDWEGEKNRRGMRGRYQKRRRREE
jgi:hypothetical protein